MERVVKNFKFGIVTYTSSFNYGCYLQRYALQAFLAKQGFESEFLLYNPPVVPISTLKQIKKSLKTRQFKSLFGKLFAKLEKKIAKSLNATFDRGRKRNVAFYRFSDSFLKCSDRLSSYEVVCDQNKNYDLFIAGSDQIWNPNNRPSADDVFFRYYMLNFAEQGEKISYAASLGASQIPDAYVPAFQKYLSDFDWISVREFDGSKELERILERNVDVVLDPVALLDVQDWKKVIDSSKQTSFQTGSYILCYSLKNKREILRKAKQIKKSVDLPLVYLCESAYDQLGIKIEFPNVKTILDAGPSEFVSLLQNAAYVVTDSFHASMFAILFHKTFFTMMRDNEDATKSMNSRMATLFSTFRLESRLFSPKDKSPLTPESFVVDYEAVDKILQERREYSINKLREAIENVVDRNANS